MIELALAMASCWKLAPEFHTWADLHDDAEAFTVNALARSQFRITPPYEQLLAQLPSEARDRQTAQRFVGTWAAKFYPNDLIFRESDGTLQTLGWGCCQYSGVRAIYASWRDAITCSDGDLYLHLLLARQCPRLIIRTRVPLAGEATIVVRQPLRVFVRIPTWLAPENFAIAVNGHSVGVADHLDVTRRYANLGQLDAGSCSISPARPCPRT
jgi:hypothetical protein